MEVTALRPSHLRYEETAPVTQCVEGWVGPRADSLICRTEKLFPALAGNQTTIPLLIRPYLSHYNDYTIPASNGKEKMSCLCYKSKPASTDTTVMRVDGLTAL